MNFRQLENSDYRKLWIAGPMLDSDWPVYFMLKLEYTEEWGDNAVNEYGRYYVSIDVVAPEVVNVKDMASALESMGTDDQRELSPDWLVVMLADYGIKATLYTSHGNNQGELLRAARKEFPLLSGILFGFKMDAPQNAIGSTGWDFISGDILGGLKKEKCHAVQINPNRQ